MAVHKKSRFRAHLSLVVILGMIFGSLFSMTSASADDQPTGEETSTVADASAPKDDSSSEAPAAPETKEASEPAPTKVETPESKPAEEKAATPDQKAPVKEEAKVSSNTTPQPDKVTICHRTASYSNPYVSISVAQSSVDGDGGNDHGQGDHYLEHTGPVFYPEIPKHTEWGDIIPPIPGVHNGLNWTEAGQAIYNNGCNVPSVDTEVTPTVPTSSDVCATADDEYTIHSKEGVEYLVDGVVKAAGTYSGTGTVEVTARALDGYKLVGDKSWTFTFTNEACPEASATWTCDSVTVHNDYTDAAKVTIAKLDQDGKVVPGTLTVSDPPVAGGADHTRSGLTKGTWDVLVKWDSSEGAVFEEMHEVTGCDTPPTKIEIPQPTLEDPCGPNNASWNEQVDTDTLRWDENDEGHLIATIIKDGVVFTDGTTTHDFGTAPDSGEECPVEIQQPGISTSCEMVTITNPVGNPEMVYEVTNADDPNQSVVTESVAGGESVNVVTTFPSAIVTGETTGDLDLSMEPQNVTVPQDCDEGPGEGDITFEPGCGFVKVTNNEDELMQFMYGSFSNSEPDGTEHIEAGKTATIKTKRSSLDYFAYFDKSGKYNQGMVKVEQKCDTPKPPSGIGTPTSLDRPLPDTGGSNLELLALGSALSVVGAGVILRSRRRKVSV